MNAPIRPLSIARSLTASVALLAASACDAPPTRSVEAPTATAEPKTEATAEPTAEAAPTEIALSKHYPAIGDKRAVTFVEQEHTQTEIAGPKGPTTEDAKTTLRVEKSEECLAVEGKVCSKLRVQITKASNKRTVSGGAANDERPLPADGKTYVLERKDGATTVRDEAGKPAPADEARLVRRACATFGQEGPLLDKIPDKVRVGDTLDGNDLFLAGRDLDFEVAPEMMTTKLKVKAIKDGGSKKIVVLEIVRTYHGALKQGDQLDGTLEGTLEVRADLGLPVKTELKGAWKTRGAKSKVDSEVTLRSADSFSF